MHIFNMHLKTDGLVYHMRSKLTINVGLCTMNKQGFSKKHIPPYGTLLMPKIRPSLELSPKQEKTRLTCGQTATQNFMPIGKAPAEKSVTVHKK